MTATLRDVADRAGVSAATVSRAFRRPDVVDEATRGRVLAAADALSYRPNAAARSLSTGRTHTLGILVPDLVNPFFPEVVKGAQSAARTLGRAVILTDSEEDPTVELELVRSLVGRVDGLVLCSTRMSEADIATAASLVPIVLINRTSEAADYIAVDNAGGIERALLHLQALGHTRIGYVAGPVWSRSGRDRHRAATEAADRLGMTLVTLGPTDPSFEGGRRAADSVLVADVTAVLAYNDVVAIGLLHQLTSYGVDIPGELSLVGFDDIGIAQMVSPQLTTVHFPRAQAGRRAIESLCARLDAADAGAGSGTVRGESEESAPLQTHLVFRGTTAGVASRTGSLVTRQRTDTPAAPAPGDAPSPSDSSTDRPPPSPVGGPHVAAP